MIWVAPTEPPALKAIATRVSLLPERFGVDVFAIPPTTRRYFGIQRKDTRDLIASITDGRLAKEVTQMARLPVAILVIEGRFKWTSDGHLADAYASRFTRTQLRRYLAGIHAAGIWVDRTDTLTDTIDAVHDYMGYFDKSQHLSLHRRPGPEGSGIWGKPSSRDWQLHLLQGFEGVGPTTAAAILDEFGGVPLQWSVTKKKLAGVKGVGKKRVEMLWGALQ